MIIERLDCIEFVFGAIRCPSTTKVALETPAPGMKRRVKDREADFWPGV
jgi:hypothetical protein